MKIKLLNNGSKQDHVNRLSQKATGHKELPASEMTGEHGAYRSSLCIYHLARWTKVSVITSSEAAFPRDTLNNFPCYEWSRHTWDLGAVKPDCRLEERNFPAAAHSGESRAKFYQANYPYGSPNCDPRDHFREQHPKDKLQTNACGEFWG